MTMMNFLAAMSYMEESALIVTVFHHLGTCNYEIRVFRAIRVAEDTKRVLVWTPIGV